MLKRITQFYRYKNRLLLNSQQFHLNSCKISPIFHHNLIFTTQRFLHISKKLSTNLFADNENTFAYNVLLRYQPKNELLIEKPVRNLQEFEVLLDQDWRSSSGVKIVEAFKNVVDFCCENNIDLSDNRFDKLVDGLMDHCNNLWENDILELMQCIAKFPRAPSVDAHNFHDIWSCLDDICCWNVTKFKIDMLFKLVECFHLLKLGRICDFTFEVIDRCNRKLKYLTKDDLVYLLFCYNICRKRPVDFDVEHKLAKVIDDFDVDQLGVIAMGYFKTKTKVKLSPILLRMIKAVEENSETINDITLSAILKIIRFSHRLVLIQELESMLNKLTPEIERLSLTSCLHIALIGLGVQYKHSESLIKSTEKILKNIELVRLKDIERILLANGTFNTNIPNLFETCLVELEKPHRRKEFAQYPRSIMSALYYLSFKKFYSYELMNEILAQDYIKEIFGDNPRSISLAVYALDASIDIECPDYKGNRLLPHQKYVTVKQLIEHPPKRNQRRRHTIAEKIFLDVYEHFVMILGEDKVRIDFVLPHFSRADLILCREKKSGQFVEPVGFANYIWGDIKWPIDRENYDWYAVNVLVPNITIRDTDEPLGTILMKKRQTEIVGYKPIFVPWTNLQSQTSEEKIENLKKLLNI